MSGYNGRRGPNVSQYIANLNADPLPQELISEPALPLEGDDFSMFMNAEFFDFEAGAGNADLDFNLDADNHRTSQASAPNAQKANISGVGDPKMDFNLSGDFQFADFANFPNPIEPSMQTLPHSRSHNFPVASAYNTSPTSSATSPIAPGFEHSTGKKRKLEHTELHDQHTIDEAARVAAEEDKRRRNTAASARFRIKKKQREQALEKTAKEMSERVSVLETRIQQLETENTWLKGLITEKSGGKASSSDIKAILHKREESQTERSTGNRTDGVGTKASESKA